MLFDEFLEVLQEQDLIDWDVANDLINGYDYDEVLERQDLAVCVECDRWEPTRNLNATNRGLVCNTCLEENYVVCDGCGEYIHVNDACFSNQRDEWFCEDCYPHYNNSDILSYHGFGYNNYHPIGESDTYFGIELEYNGDNTTEPIKELDIEKIFHFESDCTAEAFEMISQPLSFEKWKEYKTTIESIFNTMKEYTYTDDGVGLHVHISRTAFKDKLALDSFIAFINAFQTPLEKIAQRTTCYAKFDHLRTTLKDIETYGYSTEKMMAVNTLHKNSIELRIFKSTHDVNYLLDVFKVITRLIERCNQHRKYIDFKFLIINTMFDGNIGMAEDEEAYI